MATVVDNPTGHSPTTVINEKNTMNDTTQAVAPTPGLRDAATAVVATPDGSDQPSGPFKTPFLGPLPSSQPAATPKLTADQESKYDAVLKTVQSWAELPTTSAKNAPKEAITEDEKMWLTRECLLRYLRATKWNTTEAVKRLQATLVWRREYKADTFTADYISHENATGKQVLTGFDGEGRPCLYLIPSRQNTEVSEKQTHHLVFMLDRAIDLMPPGQETVALVIDYKETTQSKNPPFSQSRAILNILQGHYPERLGRALISHLPWYINTFFKLISPFIDPVTKTKMKFNEPLIDHVPSAQLLKSHGGDAEFEYDHEVYWPALNKLCDERRAAYKQRWVERGSKIGDSEWILKGGPVEEEKEKEEVKQPKEAEPEPIEKKEEVTKDEDAITPA